MDCPAWRFCGSNRIEAVPALGAPRRHQTRIPLLKISFGILKSDNRIITTIRYRDRSSRGTEINTKPHGHDGKRMKAQVRSKNSSLSDGGRSFRQREPHLETCVPRFRADFNSAPVLLHNPQGGVESEPCTFADFLGGKESLEDVRLNV